MTAPPLLDRLEQLSKGLLYPSESDFPYVPVGWGADEPAPAVVRAALGLAADAPVEVLEVRELFAPLMDGTGGAGEEEAARYGALVEVFVTELTSARALRVGAVDIDIYILGRDPSGTWIGLKTHAVET
jgi:Nuclease A inhibitor-like protein